MSDGNVMSGSVEGRKEPRTRKEEAMGKAMNGLVTKTARHFGGRGGAWRDIQWAGRRQFVATALSLVIVVMLAGASVARAQVSTVTATVVTQSAKNSAATQSASANQPSAQTVSLQELIDVATARNPAIKSAAARVQAMRSRIPQARALPDPMVSGGWMGNITPFSVQQGDPSSYRGLAVSEKLPFPGKLKLKGQIADREAEAAWWNYENTRRQIVSQVKAAYYDYFYFEKAIPITEKDRDLLQKLEKIAEAQFRVGKGIQQDVLRAQVELSRVDQQLVVLHQQDQTARVRLNTLLDRDPETALPQPATFEKSPLVYTLDELYGLAKKHDPRLEESGRMIEASQYAVNLAEKAYDPDFTVAYDYQQRPMMPDMHGVMVGINIPIFYKSKQREGVAEASSQLNSARQDHESQLITVNFEVKQFYLAAKASDDLASLYSKAIVPQSSLALESSMSSYEVGKLDFLSMLDNFLNVLNYEVNYYRELSNYEMALARLEPLVGVELTK